MITFRERQGRVFEALKERFGYVNVMQTPTVTKLVVSTGIGKVSDPKQVELIQDRLARITGQKAAPRGAKKSIASFKVRQGDIVGYQTTLRGARMRDLFDKVVHIALPRTRDFRGISPRAIDELGNVTIGITEHTIFPETSDEEQRSIFGMSITFVTTAKSKEEAEAYLRFMGMPLKNV
ncbi:MAG: 50S ribosomal protein L5 [Candidatus Pacebacteria bacterium]|nr:50S ribosomal protein L5 [Candidatus Paceibacterota bacterium]